MSTSFVRPIVSGMVLLQKILPLLLWGPLFSGCSCSAEHAERAYIRRWRQAPLVKSDNLINTALYLANGARYELQYPLLIFN